MGFEPTASANAEKMLKMLAQPVHTDTVTYK